MDRKNKIELLKGIIKGQASILDLQGHVFIVQKNGKKYLSDGFTIGREISDTELDQIKCAKIFMDEQDLNL